jgi:hypothetical protein
MRTTFPARHSAYRWRALRLTTLVHLRASTSCRFGEPTRPVTPTSGERPPHVPKPPPVRVARTPRGSCGGLIVAASQLSVRTQLSTFSLSTAIADDSRKFTGKCE